MKIELGPHETRLYRSVKFVESEHSSGTISEQSGTRTAALEIEIDIAKLKRIIGDRALKSKRRRTTLQSGSIIIRVVKGTERETSIPHVHKPRCYVDGKVICGHATPSEAISEGRAAS